MFNKNNQFVISALSIKNNCPYLVETVALQQGLLSYMVEERMVLMKTLDSNSLQVTKAERLKNWYAKYLT